MKIKLIQISCILLLIFIVTNLRAQEKKFYKEKWSEVSDTEKKGLPKSGLEIVNEIYDFAKKDKNSEQVIKSFIYKLKYKNLIEENAFEKLCKELDSVADVSPFPENAIMQTMLADMFWWYYSNNSYKFYQRTNTVNFKNDDMQTWTLDYLGHKIIRAYNLSLANKEGLQIISSDKYPELIYQGSKPKNLRPTLYDFLAHKALDFFANKSIALTKPADHFIIKEDFYFSDIKEFINIKTTTSDTLSLHYYAVKIFKDLLNFRLKDSNNHDALIDADLKRLEFVYKKTKNEKKDDLYINMLNKLEEKYKNNPFSSEISYKRAIFYNRQSHKYNTLNETTKKYQFYSKKAHEICKNTISKYPETNASQFCRSLINEIERQSIQFTIEQVICPGKIYATLINYRNTKKIYIKAAKISHSEYKKYSGELRNKELYDKLLSLSVKVYETSKELIDDGDFKNHTTEILHEKLPVGHYILFISDNDKYSYNEALASYKSFFVSNISHIKQKQSDGSYKVLVLNRSTGKAIPGVQCQTWFSKYNYSTRKYVRVDGKKYTTDNNGTFYMDAVKSRSSQSWFFDFTHNNDFLSTDRSTYVYYYKQESKFYTSTKFFTDRAIYRPGQKIYFKGISIETNGKKNEIKTGFSTTVTLYDVNRQKVSDLKVTTNEYGTFSGSFDIPLGLLNGQFRIECQSGTHYISVEEYKRPKFEVKMLPFDGDYMLNDDVSIKGNAITYSGAALSDVNVKYRITRTPSWRGWWYWGYSSTTVEIANGEIKTDAKGVFKIDFKALPDLSYPESEFTYFRYQIYADVTDINGETQSTSSSLSVGYRTLQVSLSIPSLINKNDPKYTDKKTNKININTQNLNYLFVPAKGDIKIFELKDTPKAFRTRYWAQPDKPSYTKEEWYKQFPGNIYKNENNIKELDKGKPVFTSKFDTKANKKLDFSFVTKFETGNYVAEIYSTDAKGNKVSNKHFFSVYTDKGKKMPYNATSIFMPFKTHCEPGDEAVFMIGSSLENLDVIYDIEHKGEIVSSTVIKINNDQKLIKIPIEEKHRGNVSINFIFVKNNRTYKYNSTIYVPYTNKHLDIEFETFRDKLYPGDKEKWRIKIKGSKGEKVAAEMLATLYDASLDQFRANYFSFNIYNSYYSQRKWENGAFSYYNSGLLKYGLDKYIKTNTLYYKYFNWHGFSYYQYNRRFKRMAKNGAVDDGEEFTMDEDSEEMKESEEVACEEEGGEDSFNGITREKLESNLNETGPVTSPDEKKLDKVKARTNFNETAFFYPHLKTNAEGDVIVEFTIPESLTKWKMLGLATTKDLQWGTITDELITQKELMLLPNEPRFFRENDKITFPVKISNVSEKNLQGIAKLEFFDAITMKPINGIIEKGEKATKDFKVDSKANTLLDWKLNIPEGLGAITYKIIAKAGDFSDGEQKPIPVLTNRMLVTETLPLPVRGKETKDYKFTKLINSGSSNTIKHHKLTLEFTSNPAWYAVQALPYLMEFPYECTEQTFSRFYANSIASHIANSSPKIKRVFDSWKGTPDSKALLSNLEKNQELKSVLLEETPWVLDGKDESERKKRVGLLFDLNKMSNELAVALRKIQKAQSSNGGWPWFKGMPESRYITQYIVTGMGRLDRLGVKSVRNDNKTFSMLKKAIGYLDIRIKEDYDWLKAHYDKDKLKNNHLSYFAIQYLYGRSYFKDIAVPKATKEAFDYYKGQVEKYWLSQSKYMQGMIALALHRYKTEKVPSAITKSLKEHSTSHQEMGMYWKDNVGGWYWYQAPIETHALMIEVFEEITNDKLSVNDLKIWLLKQKQTQDWKTTRATTEAVYALLMRGTDWLASDKLVEIKMDNKIIDPKKIEGVKLEAGTGYFKTSWSGSEIKPKMGNVTVTKSDEGVSWGALYWQYFEQLDKITTHETPLKLKKQLFIEKLTDRGKVIEPISDKNELKIGDKIIVRIELRVDRRMEYIHMKDMRASGFEPINVISRYKYQDGLGYYESTKDAATNFFMDALPKGTYVFEYPLRVTHKGNFSNGVTTIQCMYAPEFTSHSEGIRVNVDK